MASTMHPIDRFFRVILFPGVVFAPYLAIPATFIVAKAPPETAFQSIEVFCVVVAALFVGTLYGYGFFQTIVAKIGHPVSLVLWGFLWTGLIVMSMLALFDCPLTQIEPYWVEGSFGLALLVGAFDGHIVRSWELPKK